MESPTPTFLLLFPTILTTNDLPRRPKSQTRQDLLESGTISDLDQLIGTICVPKSSNQHNWPNPQLAHPNCHPSARPAFSFRSLIFVAAITQPPVAPCQRHALARTLQARLQPIQHPTNPTLEPCILVAPSRPGCFFSVGRLGDGETVS